MFCPYFCTNFEEIFSGETANDFYSLYPKDFILELASNVPPNYSAITFNFGKPYLMNHIKFDGKPKASEGQAKLSNPFMYKLQVSKDGSAWDTVVDQSTCWSYYTQDLYFPTKAVK